MSGTSTLLHLFQRIMDALRAVYATLSGRGHTTAESLFRAVDRGAVARRAEPGIAGSAGESHAVANDARDPTTEWKEPIGFCGGIQQPHHGALLPSQSPPERQIDRQPWKRYHSLATG